MRKPRRALFALALLALTPGQLAIGHVGIFAGALAVGFLASGHAHALSMLAELGHVDVVLHHEAEPVSDEAPPIGVAPHAGDHVVHAALAAVAHDASRRVSLGVAFVAPALAPLAADRPAPYALPAARASLADVVLLRTTVLRIETSSQGSLRPCGRRDARRVLLLREDDIMQRITAVRSGAALALGALAAPAPADPATPELGPLARELAPCPRRPIPRPRPTRRSWSRAA